MDTLRIDSLTFLASIGAVIAIELAAVTIAAEMKTPSSLTIGATRLIEIVVLWWVVRRRCGSPVLVDSGHGGVLRSVLNGLAWSLACCVAIGLCHLVLESIDSRLLDLLLPHSERSDLAVFQLYVVGCVLSPIAEEFFFRRCVFGFFRQWGFVVATLISTVAFTSLHHTASVFAFVPFVGGILFALVYEREKQLVSPILVHISGNSVILLLT